MHRPRTSSNRIELGLTPEEDAIGDPEDQEDEIDDLLPADLWFRAAIMRLPGADTE